MGRRLKKWAVTKLGVWVGKGQNPDTSPNVGETMEPVDVNLSLMGQKENNKESYREEGLHNRAPGKRPRVKMKGPSLVQEKEANPLGKLNQKGPFPNVGLFHK